MTESQSKFTMLRGHHFLRGAVTPGSLVLDLGANHGEFATAILERFGCTPRLVEANPDLYDLLVADGRFRVLHCAASTHNGTITFNIARNDEGSSILSLPASSRYGCIHERAVNVPSMTLEAIMTHFGLERLDLLKMDIEGAEVAILETCPGAVLRRIAQITVEFHCDPSFGFGGRDRAEGVMDRLGDIGFARYDFSENLTDVLFVNHGLLGTTWFQRAGLRLRTSRPPWLTWMWQALPDSWRNGIRSRMGATRS